MRIIKTLAILLVISACGGGGGSNAPDISEEIALMNHVQLTHQILEMAQHLIVP